MLISRSHKFIFIHIYKNAGTSITKALMPYTGNRIQRSIYRILTKLGVDWFDPSPYPGHITAERLVKLMGKDDFDSFYSFAFVRNPFDWQVSLYNFALKNPKHFQHEFTKRLGSFSAYIRWRCAKEVRLQKDFIYSKNGELLVDFVGRYENLDDDFCTICDHIGISTRLPHLNVYKEKPYQLYYTPETNELVTKAFAEDFEIFGYKF